MQSDNTKMPRALIITCLLIVLFWGIDRAQAFFIPIIISALLSLMMAPLVRRMHLHRFPEWSAIALSSTLLLLPFFFFGYILFWQIQSLINDFPSIMSALDRMATQLINSPFGQRLHLSRDIDISALIKRLEGSAVQGAHFLISSLSALLGAGSQIALVLLFSILMLASRKHLRTSAEKILTQSMSVKNPNILDDVVKLIEDFLIARILIVAIIAGIDFGVLYSFGIQYSFLLASLLGIMTLLPAIGFIIGVIPPLIFSFANGNGFIKTLILFLCLLFMSIIEGNVLTPKMVGGKLNINALTTFIGLFAGGLIWGIWGMFLSIPILGILRIVFNAAPHLQPWGDLMAEKSSNSVSTKSQKTKKQVA